MTSRLNPSDAEDFFGNAASAFPQELRRAVGDTLRDALAEAQTLSSGAFSTAALRRMYNPRGPYSVAAPHPPDDEAIINRQGGGNGRAPFAESWNIEGPTVNGDQIFGAVGNNNPVAGYLLGKDRPRSRMIYRPLLERLAKRIAPAAARHVGEAIERTLR